MDLKLKSLKYLDRFVGNILCELLGLISRSHKRNKEIPGSVLVIRPGGIGDAVLLLPMLKLLKIKYPDSSIDILAEKRNSGMFGYCAYINNLYEYDNIKTLDLFAVLKNKYDLVIDTEQWHRLSAVISYLTGAPERIGFGTNNRKKLFSFYLDYDQSRYESESFLDLLEEYLREKANFRPGVPFIEVIEDDHSVFAAELENYMRRFDHVAGIFTGATVRERRWDVLKYAMLAEKLLENGTGIVLLGGKADRAESNLVERILFDKDILNFTGKTSLYETTLIISLLDLFVSADTGLMHIASGVGTDTVSLFGAGNESKWAPKGKNHIVINKNLFCSPCTKFGFTPRCCFDVRCLKEISVEEVYVKSMELLND